MAEDEFFELMVECYWDAARIISKHNKNAQKKFGSAATVDYNHVPHVAAMLFQARTQGSFPDDALGAAFQ